MTSLLTPLGTRNIATLKMTYKKSHFESVMDWTDMDHNNIYSIHKFTAVKGVRAMRSEVKSVAIQYR